MGDKQQPSAEEPFLLTILPFAGLGGLAGLLLAPWALAGLVALAPENLPRLLEKVPEVVGQQLS